MEVPPPPNTPMSTTRPPTRLLVHGYCYTDTLTQLLVQVGLAAEDGYVYKWPGSPLDRWDARVHLTNGWKEVAVGLMSQYTQRTNGSYIEDDKTSSATWQARTICRRVVHLD